MDDNPGTSIMFEGPVATYDNDNEEDEEEIERRQQEREIQERLQGGELDGILGEEDFQYSSEEDDDADDQNQTSNMSLTSNARRSSISRRNVNIQQQNGGMPGGNGLNPAANSKYYPQDGQVASQPPFTPSREQNTFSNANYSTPASSINPPLQVLGSVIMPDNGRFKQDHYQPHLPAIADQTLEQINEDYQTSSSPDGAESTDVNKTPKNPNQPMGVASYNHNMNQYGFMHSLDRFAATTTTTTASMPNKLPPEVEHDADLSVTIDLEELQKEQANKLLIKQDNDEQGGLSLKYEELFKEYNKCQMLLKLRGKKLEETSNSAAVMQEDYNRQLRAMSHRLHLADQESDELRRRLDEALEKQRGDEERFAKAEKSQRDIQEANGELVKKNALLLAKIGELESDVESLNFQISEQEKNDTIETITKRYEMAIEQMRDQHAKESQQYQESLSRCQMEIGRHLETIKSSELHMSELNEHNSLLEAQLGQLRARTSNDQQMLEKLTLRCQELEQKVATSGAQNGGGSGHQMEAATMETLKKELDRALEGQSKKRAECQALKEQVTLLSKRLGEHEAVREKLEKERQELGDELRDTKTWLDNLLAKEEHINSAQATMQNLDLIVEENEKKMQTLQDEIGQLRLENEQLLMHGQAKEAVQQEFFVQINDLKLEIANLQTENGKIKKMYLEVCNEKANLEAVIKEQYDAEYAKRLDVQLEARLEEERRALADSVSKQSAELVEEHKKELASRHAEIASLRSKLSSAEETVEATRKQKADLERRLSAETSALSEQLASREKLLKESKSEQEARTKQLEDELIAQKSLVASLERQKSELDARISELTQSGAKIQSELEAEKTALLRSLEEAVAARAEAVAQNGQLGERLKLAEEKSRSHAERLSQTEAQMGRLSELEGKLARAEAQLEAEVRERSAEREKMKEAYEAEFTQLADKFGAEVKLTTRLGEENETMKQHLANLQGQLSELQQRLDKSKLDMSKALEEKDKECEKVCGQLQQRYQEDYDKFMRDHKAIVQKIIQEKRAEHEAEIEALIRKHEEKADERDQEEQRLLKQIKELKSAIQNQSQVQAAQTTPQPRSTPRSAAPRPPVLVDAKVQTDLVAVSEVATSFSADYTTPVREEDLQDHESTSKMAFKDDYIRQLEEMLKKTDSHFKQEIEKMMLIEDGKRAKLESEVQLLRKHLAQVKDRLKSSFCTTIGGGGVQNDNYDNESGTDLESEIDSTLSSQHSHSKYFKLRRRLNQKDEEMGTIEQAYRLQIEGLEAKFNRQLDKSRKELESKERECVKARDELARLRAELTKQRDSSDFFRKSLADSEKIIESLKVEMKLNKENHLTELASAKMREEMEKKSLKMRCQELEREIEAVSTAAEKRVQKSLAEAEATMSRMRESHEEEMAKMKMRAKDLVKQAGRLHGASLHSSQAAVSVQTDLDQSYIQQLIEFKQKHLEVLAQWKASLLDQMDIHSANNLAALQKHLSGEYVTIREKYMGWLVPKARALLENLGSSEFTINRLATLLELELDSILKPQPLPDALREKQQHDCWSTPAESSKYTKRSVSVLSGSGKAYMDAKTKSDLISSIAAIKASINSTESEQQHKQQLRSSSSVSIVRDSSSLSESSGSLGGGEEHPKHPKSALKSTPQSSTNTASTYTYTPIQQSMSYVTPRNRPEGMDYISDYASPYLQRKVPSWERPMPGLLPKPSEQASRGGELFGGGYLLTRAETEESARCHSGGSNSTTTTTTSSRSSSSSISVKKIVKSPNRAPPPPLVPAQGTAPAFSSTTLPRSAGAIHMNAGGPPGSLTYRNATASSARKLTNVQETKKKPFVA